MSFEDALDAEGERRSANWTWGWGYVDVGLYAEQVKAYMDNFERVLLILFEQDIGQIRDSRRLYYFFERKSINREIRIASTDLFGL